GRRAVIRFEQPLFLKAEGGQDLVVPEHIAARPILLADQLPIETDRFIRFRIVLRHDRQAGALAEVVEQGGGEFLVLGAVQHDARLGTRAAGTAKDDGQATRVSSHGFTSFYAWNRPSGSFIARW